MIRGSSAEALRRAFGFLARGTLVRADDSRRMQEAEVRLLHDERHDGVERPQNYGFTSVPLPQSDGEAAAAEVFVGFLSGTRSHGVILASDDRRHRPRDLKEGETCQYDDLKQKTHLTREGIVHESRLKITLRVVDASGAVKSSIELLPDGRIILTGDCYIGGADASRPASARGTIDTGGNADISNPATKVWLK